MTPTISPPPVATAEPVTDILHGVAVPDPYRWLEDQNSPRTRKWLEEQIIYTRAYLDAVPGRELIRSRIEKLLAVEVISAPYRVGNRYFFSKRTPHQEQAVITMRVGLTGEDIPLVDPAERSEGSATAVGILRVSNDGKLLAYGVRSGGEDAQAVEILDVDRREVLPDRLARGFYAGLVFSPDAHGFYYSHNSIDSARPHYRAIYWHAFGKPAEDVDSETFFAGEDPKLRLVLLASQDGSKLCIYRMLSDGLQTTDVYVQDLTGGAPPRLIVEQIEGKFYAFLSGNHLVALTNWKSPKGRIVAIDLDRPQRANWVDIVPETDACVRDLAVSANRIFVGYTENAVTRIEIFDTLGRSCGRIPSPPYSTTRLLQADPTSDEVFYSCTSFSQPPSIYCYHANGGHQEPWAQHQVPFDGSWVEVEQIQYRSKDGTQIPMFLVSQEGRRHSGPLPTFLTGYGGFGNSITPQFTVYGSFLIEHGCLLAIANIRGGAEFGEEWHLAAKRHKRQNAIDDFIAAAEWLLTAGQSIPGRIAIGGGSNAGLLVGAALTQRPDLFRAVVCLGPLLDMLRYHKFDQANSWIEEFGCADIRDDFHHLQAYSPYHQVKDGVAYPAVMLISGDADTRCNPMHARKMAARVQAATSSGYPILLDYKPRWGHMPVQPLNNRIEALTDRLAFICHELGVNV